MTHDKHLFVFVDTRTFYTFIDVRAPFLRGPCAFETVQTRALESLLLVDADRGFVTGLGLVGNLCASINFHARIILVACACEH